MRQLFFCDGSGWSPRLKKSRHYICAVENSTCDIDCLSCVDSGEICPLKSGKISYSNLVSYPEARTNNEMEYEAVIDALIHAKTGDLILSDSQLVVNQLTNGWRVKEQRLLNLWMRCREMMRDKDIQIKWIPREKNRAGKYLEGGQ